MARWRAGWLLAACALTLHACAANDDGGIGDPSQVADAGGSADLDRNAAADDVSAPGTDADPSVDADRGDGDESDGPGPPDARPLESDGADDAGVGEGLWWACPTSEIVTTSLPEGNLLGTTRYAYDEQNRPLGYTNTDADGAIVSSSVATWDADLHQIETLDAPYDGVGDLRYRRTYGADRRLLVIDTLYLSGERPDVRTTNHYADDAVPETQSFWYAERAESDIGIDGSIDQLSVFSFSAGRVTRFESDRSAPEYENGTSPRMDGTWDWVETYEYVGNRVIVRSDGGGASCSSEWCTANQPDGEPDRITEYVFGPDGEPDLLYAGRPIELRYDWEADGVVDHATYLSYDDEGRLAYSEQDAGADGVREQRYRYSYTCN